MSLTKEKRDALPDDMFAFPRTRQVPMHDDTHTRLGWDMVDRVKGVTNPERHEARQRLLQCAKEQGVDTGKWHISASVSFEAMAIQMPNVPDHPNRMPFTGVLTKVDELSDAPPGGAQGVQTYLPSEVAEAALASLLGMAVDYKPKFDGHDRQSKIGLITAAEIVGNELRIEGFFYAKDFPGECEQIRTEKDRLGFSFEADARIQDTNADPWVIENCVFTGAAVLYKELAAYTTTSLAASADKGMDMTPEELKAILNDAVKPLTDKIDAQGKELAELKAAASLGGPIIDQVKPHVDAINACAASMEASGVGNDPKSGHAGVLRKVAAHLAAGAVSGTLPKVYRDHDYLPDARVEAASAEAIAKAVEAAVAPLKAELESAGTKLVDLQAKAFNSATPPARATITPEIKTLLARAGIAETDVDGGKKLTTDQVNKVLDAQGVHGARAIETKLKLRHAGLMEVGKAA